MANNLQISTTARNAACDAVTALIGASGTLKIYDGSQPAGPGTAVSSQTLLATLTFGATPFGASSSGTATANAITSETNAVAGTAAWFRIATSGGTAHIDGSVGTSGADINFNSVTFTTGATIAVSSLTLTMPAH